MDIAVPRKMVMGAAGFLALVAALGLYLGLKGSFEHNLSEGSESTASTGQPTATATTASVEAKALTPESSAPAASSAPPKSAAPAASSALAQSDDEDNAPAEKAPAPKTAKAPLLRDIAPPPETTATPAPPPQPQRPPQPSNDDLPPF